MTQNIPANTKKYSRKAEKKHAQQDKHSKLTTTHTTTTTSFTHVKQYIQPTQCNIYDLYTMKKWCINKKREKKGQHSEKRHHWKIKVLGLSQSGKDLSTWPTTCHKLIWALKQTNTQILQKQYTAPTSTLKHYIQVMKNQIYVQTKENTQKDSIQTHKQENDRETNQNPRNAVLQPWTKRFSPNRKKDTEVLSRRFHTRHQNDETWPHQRAGARQRSRVFFWWFQQHDLYFFLGARHDCGF